MNKLLDMDNFWMDEDLDFEKSFKRYIVNQVFESLMGINDKK